MRKRTVPTVSQTGQDFGKSPVKTKGPGRKGLRGHKMNFGDSGSGSRSERTLKGSYRLSLTTPSSLILTLQGGERHSKVLLHASNSEVFFSPSSFLFCWARAVRGFHLLEKIFRKIRVENPSLHRDPRLWSRRRPLWPLGRISPKKGLRRGDFSWEKEILFGGGGNDPFNHALYQKERHYSNRSPGSRRTSIR